MKRPQTNLLDLTPRRTADFSWQQDADGTVTLLRPNRGFWNRLARLLYAAPRQTSIRMDALGSFVWTRLDGTRTVEEVAQAVHERFAEAAEPLYPRLAQYLRLLQDHGWITLQGAVKKHPQNTI